MFCTLADFIEAANNADASQIEPGLPLASFEPTLGFIDDKHPTATTHNPAVGMAIF